jgi:hypothetical protein
LALTTIYHLSTPDIAWSLSVDAPPVRGGKYSGPWDHWSQKMFYAGRKKKGKEEKGGKKEKKRKREKKEKERKKKEGKKKNRKKERVIAPISSHFVQGQTIRCRGCPQNNLRKNFDSGM